MLFAPSAGYLHLIKCHMRLSQLADAAKVLQSAPMGLRTSNAELSALAETVRDEVKAKGNAAFLPPIDR